MKSATDPRAYLFGLEHFGIKLGLENIQTILEALGHPQRTFHSVHVAGTNGKGSVTAMIDAALRAGGLRSARYTSPHFVRLTERFVIAGHELGDDALDSAIADLRVVIDGLLGCRILRAHPTFFETTTAVAFEVFRRHAVDVAVCEAGLGGRLDATNALEPTAAVITSIGLDHEQHLGTTLAEIAREKAGIIKTDTPVVIGELPQEARETIEAVAAERGAPLVQAWAGTEASLRPSRAGFHQSDRTLVRLRTPRHDYGEVEIALAGAHQVGNAVVAVRLLELLGDRGIPLSPDAITAGLASVSWPGRLDWRRLPDGQEVLLDAAHNPDGAQALSAYLRARGGRALPIVFAAARDKDTSGMLRALAPVAGGFVFTRASSARAADPQDLAARARPLAPELPLIVEPKPHDALAAAWRLSPTIVVAGSIFLLGDVMKILDSLKSEV